MKIRIHKLKDSIRKLGPGVRYVIWTQGCNKRCSGCMTPESRDLQGGELLEAEDLAERIVRSGRTELTISGGEPFLQAEALAELIDKVRVRQDLGVIVYTGYVYEELKNSPDINIQKLLEKCDLIIDGPFIEELCDGKNLRGSSNQRAIPLTDRYEEFAKTVGTKPAEVEFILDSESMVMVGVPSPDLLNRIRDKEKNY